MYIITEKINQFLSTVHQWFIEQGEVFIRIELFPSAGYMDCFIYNNYPQFVEDLKSLPRPNFQTSITAIKNVYLP